MAISTERVGVILWRWIWVSEGAEGLSEPARYQPRGTLGPICFLIRRAIKQTSPFVSNT